MKSITTLAASTIVASGLVAGGMLAANADHSYGDWQPIPAHMVGDTCDAIDNGSPTFVLGEHAVYVDQSGTRYVITMPGRICSS